MGIRARHAVGAALALGFAVLSACGDDADPAAPDPAPGETVADETTTTAPDGTTTTTAAPGGPTTVVTTTPPDTDLGPLRLGEGSALSTLGIGPVHFGMTISDAEQAAGTRLLPHPGIPAGHDCIVLAPEDGPEGVLLTVTARTVERVDIEPPARVATRSGAAIGTTVAELEQLFGDQLVANPAGDGVTYEFVPVDPNDAAFRVIFETDGATVTSLRAGRVAQVQPPVPCR